MGLEEFSATQEVDDPICACQQGNLFYLDMPQKTQDQVQLSFAVNGQRTPILTAEEPYRHLNTREGTAGALQCYIQGREYTLIPDLSEASFGSPEDLKVVVGHEPPTPEMIQRYNRLERVKQLVRDDGRVTRPTTTGSRISQIETEIRHGVADNEHQEELNQIMRRVEAETGEYYMQPAQDDILVIEMMPENVLPQGQYDIETVAEPILDKIGNTIIGVFGENFDNLINMLVQTGDFAASKLPAAMLEFASAGQVLANMAEKEVLLMRSIRGVRTYADQEFLRNIRTNPAYITAFKREFILALLKQKVVRIQLFKNAGTALSFKTHGKIRMAMGGTYKVRTYYKSGLFEASAQATSGRFGSLAKGVGKGVGAIGIGLVFYSEFRAFFDTPEAEREWSDLIVGLGVEITKVLISTFIAGLAIAALIFLGFLTGALWMVIVTGALISIAVNVVLNSVDEAIGAKKSIQNAVRSLPPVTRHGESIRW